MDKFCRGCLVRYDETTELYQYTERNRRLFVYSTGLQVKRNDTFIFQLCKDCYLSMKVACKFRKQCRNSDKAFKAYLALKETDECLDLPTFLKTNDDSWTFRFPPIFESSTPAYHKAKDDDNDSTTASIRNFICDIMPEADLPDSEARIVREVIEEHDDLLEDSLDSHWLHEDASIDNDLRLDFSFSPFITPRSGNERYTPKKIEDNKSIDNNINCNQKYLPTKKIYPLIDDENQPFPVPVKVERDYNETDHNLDTFNDIIKNESEILNDANEMPAPRCTIDKNLEAALRDTDNSVFDLDDLLVSPKVIPEMQLPPKSLIEADLFKEEIDIDDNSNDSHKYKAGRNIESYENVKGDVDMDYLDDTDVKDETFDLNSENEAIVTEYKLADDKKVPESTNFYCKMCDKTFKSLLGMKRHSAWHNTGRLRILNEVKGSRYICDQCGARLKSKANLRKHLRIMHAREQQNPICDLCKSEFRTKAALIRHLKSHAPKKRDKIKELKRYVCPECGASTDKSSNLLIHMRRHQKIFAVYCQYCTKGFYRKAELTIHMRYHTGEKPYLCDLCNKGFVRRDALTRHMKHHLDLKPFKCRYCNSRFVNSTNLNNHHKSSKMCRMTRDKIARDQRKKDGELPAVYVNEEIHMRID